MVKNLPASAGDVIDMDSIPGLGRSPGGGHGNTLQYSSWIIPWTVAHQAPLSMGILIKNTGVCCHALLQGIFATQGSNAGIPHCRQTLYQLRHKGNPNNSKNRFKISKNLLLQETLRVEGEEFIFSSCDTLSTCLGRSGLLVIQ